MPNEAVIEADLEPRELFGHGVPSGALAIVRPGGGPVQLAPDVEYGAIRATSESSLGDVSFTAVVFGYHVEVRGPTIRVRARCDRTEDVLLPIGFTEIYVPALLASAVPAPVRVRRIRGRVGDSPFAYEYRGSVLGEIHAMDGEGVARRMKRCLERADRLPNGMFRVFAAFRYLMQARRLRHASTYPGEFLGERFLNLYKAVEVVFGRDVDAMRERLRNLGADDQVVEGLIVPLTYVRDSLDVGHSKIAPLPQPDYETIHDYAVRAENGVTWLLDLLVSRIIDGTFEVSSYSPDPDRVATLFTKLREYQAVRVDPYAAGATSEVSP